MGTCLILDHHVLFDLWADPYFWEILPELEADRAQAEILLAHELGPFVLKTAPLYNQWIQQLKTWVTDNPEAIQRLTSYIQQRRRFNDETIVLPDNTVIFQGVETWPYAAFD
jgi:hypothetical protein